MSTTTGGTVLSKDFKEFIELLNKNDVKYLIIGGYAVAAHGHPRYTKDLDVWIEASERNADSLISALRQFGFGSLDLKQSDFSQPDQIIQLGFPPHRIDILTTADGIEFTECFAHKVVIEIDGVSISFIGIDELKQNKRTTGRHQDLADIEALESEAL